MGVSQKQETTIKDGKKNTNDNKVVVSGWCGKVVVVDDDGGANVYLYNKPLAGVVLFDSGYGTASCGSGAAGRCMVGGDRFYERLLRLLCWLLRHCPGGGRQGCWGEG